MNPPDALLGALVGQYRITRELARGGMGVVYEAVHEAIGQRAAVKVLQDLSGRASSRSRFLNEARAVSLVHHPGLVRVFDFGELPTGKPYILMELVEGESLRERLARGGPSLEVGTALRIARQIAAALCAVHARDIIHRDLKPENVMLVRDEEAAGGERVKLLDFGIARLVGDGSVRTTEGVVLGTALYMAPEQCAGSDDLDDRADVYALGVVLYELLAGGPPFQGEPTAVMRQHLFQEPPPLPERLRLPGELPALLRRMLAKEPSRRPRMVELAEALQQLERGAFVEAPGPGSRELARPPAGPDARDGIPTVAERRPPPATLPPSSRRWPGGRVGAAVGVVLLAAPAAWVVTARLERAPPRVPALDGMVLLPGGRFRMGSTPEELEAWCASAPGGCTADDRKRLERELPAHDVTLSPFQLDRYEVTHAQFAAFLNRMASSVEVREDKDDHSPRFVYERASGYLLADLHPAAGGIEPAAQGHFAVRPGMENRPVVQMTWDGASRYCRFLGKRLPTEAEWELAARGVARRVYPWGDAPPRCDGVVFGRHPGAGCEHLLSALVDVGSAPDDVTPEGIHDLAGSVGEWVGDAFTRPYYEDCGECLNPRAAEPGVPILEDLRLFRGGSYQSDALLSRAATRSRWKRGGVMAGLGLRCASD